MNFYNLTSASPFRVGVDDRRILIEGRPLALQTLVQREVAVPCHAEFDGGSLELRTNGQPTTVRKLLDTFGDMCRDVGAENGIDWRILLVQAACEAWPSPIESCGKSLRSPRTEVGYPDRKDENDVGDYRRDEVDWYAHGGIHSSHGLTQCLIGTAVNVRPDLFQGVQPSHYRDVLADPRNAFECLAADIKRARPEVQSDVVGIRCYFGAGGLYPSAANLWGARMYNASVLLHWICFWNDLGSLTI